MTPLPVPPKPDAAAYMSAVASSAVGAHYKKQAIEALELCAGHTVVDVGCGPGTDLRALSLGVGRTGAVLGLDRDDSMLARASVVAAECGAEVRKGDVHALPLSSASVDRLRTDRVLQHVRDPEKAMAEIGRVLRPGGRAVFAEPDWDTLAIAAEDASASRRYRDFVRDVVVRNGDIGRHLPRYARGAGLDVRRVVVSTGVLTSYESADMILGMTRNVERGIAAGALDQQMRPWADSLRADPFVAAVSMFVVTVEVPPHDAAPEDQGHRPEY